MEVDKNDLNRKLGANEEKIAQLTELKTKLQQDLESTKTSTLDINSELSNLNKELNLKQGAFEAYQNEAEANKLNLERRVDELARQSEHLEQQCSKLKNEMEALNIQKIESENQLNQDLQNIKTSSDEEKTELDRELHRLRGAFESEKRQLNREKQEIQEALEKAHEELEAKIRDLEATIERLKAEVEKAKMLSKDNESSMGVVVEELKAKEAKLVEELNTERSHTDELKKSLEELGASKEILKSGYEEKLLIGANKISKLQEDLVAVTEQQKMASAGTDEKIRILDEIQAKSFVQEQKITDLTHQLQNETSLKKKLEGIVAESEIKFRELEDEQVDLVHRESQLKEESDKLQINIEQMKELHKSLDEKLKLEKKDSEHFKIVSEERIHLMESSINDLRQEITSKEQEKDVVIEKLHLREEEVVQLQAAIKDLEAKLERESEDVHKLLKGKDKELLKVVKECTTKDNLISDLKTNLDNIQSCLKLTNSEKDMTSELVQKLNQEISTRDSDIRDLKMKVYEVEKVNKDIEDQIKNILNAKNQLTNESKMQINDLLEQVQLLEQVKEREVEELSTKMTSMQSQMKMNASSVDASETNLKASQVRETDFLKTIKTLELKETELSMANQALKRKVDELETMKGVPRTGDAYDQEMQSHIDFLNSIITDMHMKNLKLTQQVELLESGPSAHDASG